MNDSAVLPPATTVGSAGSIATDANGPGSTVTSCATVSVSPPCATVATTASENVPASGPAVNTPPSSIAPPDAAVHCTSASSMTLPWRSCAVALSCRVSPAANSVSEKSALASGPGSTVSEADAVSVIDPPTTVTVNASSK